MVLPGFVALLSGLSVLLPGMAETGVPLLRGTGNGGWHHREVPSPMEAPELCHLNTTGALCDVDGILSPDGRSRAVALLRQVQEETSAPCGQGAKGYQIGVALVRRMHSDDWVRGDAQETAKQFAAKIGDRWGVGEKDCSNGIMVFLSTGDRTAYIKTAPGSQGALSDHQALLVLEKMKPLLREGNYDDAVALGLSQVKAVLQGASIAGDAASAYPESDKSIFQEEGFWAGLLVVICLLSEVVTCGNGLVHWVFSSSRSDSAKGSSSFGGGGDFDLGGGAGITW